MNKVNIFISWSGERSKKCAELLSKWLPRVIQAVTPFYSPDDIAKGTFWFGEISKQLNESTLGIICLTEENKNKPWILFEVGALNKGLSSKRVCPILVDLEPKDVDDPISKFQLTKMDKDDMFKLFKNINDILGDMRLSDAILEDAFSATWDKFYEEWQALLSVSSSKENTRSIPKKTNEELIETIIDVVRSIDRKTDTMESRLKVLRAGYVEEPDKSELLNLEFEERSFVKKYSSSLKKGMGYYVLNVFCNSDGWRKVSDLLGNFDNATQCGGPLNHLSHGVLLLNDFEVYFTSASFISDYLIKEVFKLGGIYRVEIRDGYNAKLISRFALTMDEAKQQAELYSKEEQRHYPKNIDKIESVHRLFVAETLPILLDTDNDYPYYSSSLDKHFGKTNR